jgi:hypothetical protein
MPAPAVYIVSYVKYIGCYILQVPAAALRENEDGADGGGAQTGSSAERASPTRKKQP